MNYRFKNNRKIGLLSSAFCLFGLLLLFAACQKDDICPASTPTTPMLIIRFYDYQHPSELKPVQGLNLLAEGQTDSLFVQEKTTDSIAIPLKTFQNYTHYQFIRHLGDEGENELEPNSDQLDFSYFPNDVYLNKACGFITEYLDFQANLISEEEENWIQNIVVKQTTIDDETNAHLFIFH